ncbi:MAG TPA: DUF1003 domain-containing protein [Flavobacterium sp.]|nr:DUF1003 domain-containing protein [Flavobacterium sp.]
MINESNFLSDISSTEYPESERVSAKLITKPLFNLIRDENPDFTRDSCISISELNSYKVKYISHYFASEIGDLSPLENTVMNSLSTDKLLVSKVEDEDEGFTFGEKIADKVAEFGGSWTFIITFGIVIVLWIGANVYMLSNKGFDPYPFILLNLVLSCLAALQAPVIMMSQNRQEDKDRDRAGKDYMINLKSELEIRMIHEKLDYLIMNQQQELIDFQKKQMEMMDEILNRMNK